jgi:replication factor C large subunit
MLTWVEKYRPQSLKKVAGNPTAIKTLIKWVEEWRKGKPKKRAILLHGPPGTGKTSAAYALARELGYDCIELNASDSRTKDVINRVVGNASTLGTLSPDIEKKILIIDEVDGIHGKADYGGLAALRKWIKTTLQPLILIANDPWSLPKEFRAQCEMVAFKRIDQRTIVRVLKEICSAEGISTDEKVLKLIATNANGDLRSAINDLQSLSEGRKTLSLEDTDVLTLRDSEMRIFDTLIRIFKGTSCDRAIEAIRESGEQPETIMKWVAENLPVEYEDPDDLARGFDSISRADVFMGRIMRRQDWSLLKYVIDFMSAGVAMAKKERYHKWSRYQYPETFALYSRTKKQREIIDAIAAKLQGKKDGHTKCHGSKRLMKLEFLPLLRIVLKNNFEMGAKMASELNLALEEIQFFVADAELAKKIYNKAAEITAERIRSSISGRKQFSLFEFT